MPPKPIPSFHTKAARKTTFYTLVSCGSGTKERVFKWLDKHDEESARVLTDCGFYYNPTPRRPNRALCFSCGAPENFHNDDVHGILRKHYIKHNQCILSLSDEYTRIPDSLESNEDLHQYWTSQYPAVLSQPLSPAAVVLRMKTFGNSFVHDKTRNFRPTLKNLAEAGFVYSPSQNNDDEVTCIYCGCRVSGWSALDSPIAKHQSQAKTGCFFLTQYNDSLPAHERAIEKPLPTKDAIGTKKKRANTYLGVISDLDSEDLTFEENVPKTSGNVTDSGSASRDLLQRSLTRKRAKRSPTISVAASENDSSLALLDSSDDVELSKKKRTHNTDTIISSPLVSQTRSPVVEESASPGQVSEDLNESFWDKSPEKSLKAPIESLPKIRITSDSDNEAFGVDTSDTTLQTIAHASNTYSKKRRTRAPNIIQSDSDSGFDANSSSDKDVGTVQNSKENAHVEDELFIDSSMGEEHHFSQPSSSKSIKKAGASKAHRDPDNATQESSESTSSRTKERVPATSLVHSEQPSSDLSYTPSTSASGKNLHREEEYHDESTPPFFPQFERPRKRLRIKRDIPPKSKRRNVSSDPELNSYDAKNVSLLEKQIDKAGILADLSPASLHLPAAKVLLSLETKPSLKAAKSVLIPPKKPLATAKTAAKRSVVPAARSSKRPNIFDMSMDLDFFTPKPKSRSERRHDSAHSLLPRQDNLMHHSILGPKRNFLATSSEQNLDPVYNRDVLDPSDHESNMPSDVLAESTFNGVADKGIAKRKSSKLEYFTPIDQAHNQGYDDTTGENRDDQSLQKTFRESSLRSQFDDTDDSIFKNTKCEDSKPEDGNGSDTLYADYMSDLKSIQNISLQLDDSDNEEGEEEEVVGEEGEDEEDKYKEEVSKGEVAEKKVVQEDEDKDILDDDDNELLMEKLENGNVGLINHSSISPTNPENDDSYNDDQEDVLDTSNQVESSRVEILLKSESRNAPNAAIASRTSMLKQNPSEPQSLHRLIDVLDIRDDSFRKAPEEYAQDSSRDEDSKSDEQSADHGGKELSLLSDDDNTTVTHMHIVAKTSDEVDQSAIERKLLVRKTPIALPVVVEDDARNTHLAPSPKDVHRLKTQVSRDEKRVSKALLKGKERQRGIKIPNQISNATSNIDHDESDRSGDETVIRRPKQASSNPKHQNVSSSTSHEERHQEDFLHENPASHLDEAIITHSERRTKVSAGRVERNHGAPKVVQNREQTDSEKSGLSSTSHNQKRSSTYHDTSKTDQHTASHTHVNDSLLKSTHKSVNDQSRGAELELSSRDHKIRQHADKSAHIQESGPTATHETRDESNASHVKTAEVSPGGDVSGDLDKASPQTGQDAEKSVLKWTPLSTDSLAGILENMADASQMLKNLKDSPFDLHDDLGELTSFIAEMPEHEENMTIEEWVQHTAANTREMIRDFTEQAIQICSDEYDRAAAFIEALETSD